MQHYYFVLVESPYEKGLTKMERQHRKEEREKYYRLVEEHHSYVAKRRHVGRHIGWLIYHNSILIGCIGIGSYFLPEPKALKEYIGWNERKDKNFNCNFNKVANNWRFTLVKDAPKNAGSKCLSILAKIAPKAWKEKYGNDLILLVSLVGGGHEGTCFKAANWKYIGKTAGTSTARHGSFTMSKRRTDKGEFGKKGEYGMPKTTKETFKKKDRKLIFVMPLHRNWRGILTKCWLKG